MEREAEAAAALHAAAFAGRERAWTAAEMRALMATPGVFMIAEPDGFLLGRVAAGEAEVLTVAVRPEARRRGLGRRLLAAFEARAARSGATAGFLEVARANHGARALYTAAGWTVAGLRRGYYRAPDGTRDDAIVLVRTIVAK